MKLQGMAALVTGAGRGIGLATAVRLAQEGADVAVADIDAESAARAADKIRRLERVATAITTDVSNIVQVDNMVARAWDTFGRLDILVNNAGVISIKDLLEISPEDWDRIFAVNVRGLFFCLQRVAQRMITRRFGKIINVASIAAKRPRPLAAHYAASKAAVISITHSAAAALATYGVTVNAICPGLVDTTMETETENAAAKLVGLTPEAERTRRLTEIPLGRAADPGEIATVVAFLASSDAGYMTGQTLNVCGGLRMD